MDNFKPGGGNKLQPYIPAGNGEKSGEYTNKSSAESKKTEKFINIKNCYIRNVKFKYNYFHSKLVEKVNKTFICFEGTSIGSIGVPNSVAKKIVNGYIVTERYYNSYGEAYLDIDYTCHGNLHTHPYVPHIHRWVYNEHGLLVRQKWEKFQWK